MKKVLGCIRRADQRFAMIQPGDAIAVGVSGGKDSLLLLLALDRYRLFSKTPFTLTAVTLHMGLEPFDTAPIAALCARLGVPYVVRHTRIGAIVIEERKEPNPCALCARMRRGALHNLALELGCNKIALGHHREDALETLMMNILREGRMATFSPVTYLSRKNITLIRPMILLDEPHIRKTAQRLELPVVKNPCPVDGHTERQRMKQLLGSLSHQYPKAREYLLHALLATENYNLWDGAHNEEGEG